MVWQDILGTDRKAVLKFKDDLIQKRKDASPLFRTVAIRKPTAGPQSGLDPSANMKVYRKKETEADPLFVLPSCVSGMRERWFTGIVLIALFTRHQLGQEEEEASQAKGAGADRT